MLFEQGRIRLACGSGGGGGGGGDDAFQRRGPNMVARAVRLSSVGLYHGKAGLFSKRSLATL